MTKTTKAAAAPTQPADTAPVLTETPSLRDEFAMRMAAAIIGAIVNRSGFQALQESFVGGDDVVDLAYYFADRALIVRAK